MRASLKWSSVFLYAVALLPLVLCQSTCPPTVETCMTAAGTADNGLSFAVNFYYTDEAGAGNICGLSSGSFGGADVGPTQTTPTLSTATVGKLTPTSTFDLLQNGNYKFSIGASGSGATPASTSAFAISGTGPFTEGGTPPSPDSLIASPASKFSYAWTTSAGSGSGHLSSLTISGCPNVAGDPLFVGFHGQHYKITGVPDRVFNLLSMPQLQLNSRFIALDESQVMTRNEMVAARIEHFRHNRKLPVTLGAFHTGIYMGELGFKVSGVRIYVAAGEYETGFASVTINGEEVPVSNASISVANGAAFITRRTPYVVTFTTVQLVLTVVNSDNFVNIENVALTTPYTGDLSLSGLLGVSADPDWSADIKTIQRRAVDESMLEGDDIFGNDFNTNKYTVAK